MNQLAPGVKRREFWIEDEGSTRVLLQSARRNRWSLVAVEIKGRTGNRIKNRFKPTLERKRDAGGTTCGLGVLAI